MDWPVIFKWTLFSYRNPVYLNLWLWSIYITCVFCLYLLLFIFLLIQLLFFTLYMHVNVKHVNTYIYIYIPKFNFNLTVNMDLVVIFFCSDSLPLTIDNLLKRYLQTRISPSKFFVEEILAWLYYAESMNVLAVNAVHCVPMVLSVPLLSYKMFTLHWMNK